MELEVLRPTSLASFVECPARWHAEQDKERDPEGNDYAAWGTWTHAACEKALRGEMRPGSADWSAWWSNAPKRMPRHEVEAAERYVAELCEQVDGGRLRVLSIETRFTAKVADDLPAISGQPDLIAWDNANSCWLILDHKTNRHPEPAEVWSRRIQQRCYAWWLRRRLAAMGDLALRKKAGKKVFERSPADFPIDFAIGYALLGETVRWRTDPWDDYTFAEQFRELCAEIVVYSRTGEWPERLNTYCSSCPRVNECPTTARAFETLRTIGDEPEEEATLLARYAEAQAVLKLAEARADRLKEEVKDLVAREGGSFTDGRYVGKLQTRSRRSAPFSQVWAILRLELDRIPDSHLDDLFTVKVSALDKQVERFPDLAEVVTAELQEPALVLKPLNK